MARKQKDEVDFSKLSRKERREEARKMLFGDFKESERTNIWGKKFSLFSLAGLTVIGVIAIISVKTGHIDPQNLPEDEPYLYQHFLRKDKPVKDTLN